MDTLVRARCARAKRDGVRRDGVRRDGVRRDGELVCGVDAWDPACSLALWARVWWVVCARLLPMERWPRRTGRSAT
eukprot:1112819-Prymnesium_polylepis.1